MFVPGVVRVGDVGYSPSARPQNLDRRHHSRAPLNRTYVIALHLRKFFFVRLFMCVIDLYSF